MTLCAVMGRVFQKNGPAMVLKIVIMEQMKTQNSVPAVHLSFFAQMAGVQIWRMFVMDKIIVGITVMKLKFVLVSIECQLRVLRVHLKKYFNPKHCDCQY